MSNLSEAQRAVEITKLHTQLTIEKLSPAKKAEIISGIDDLAVAKGLVRELVKDLFEEA